MYEFYVWYTIYRYMYRYNYTAIPKIHDCR